MTKKRSINSKQKGARFERAIANWLTQNGYPARRGQQFKGTPDSPDVICESLPFNIECKHVEALNIYKAMQQSEADAGDNAIDPIVIHKRNNEQTLVTMRADDWICLVSQVIPPEENY